jgi:glutathione synthase/RimK-type ligase-like ATP-grasp enzyme
MDDISANSARRLCWIYPDRGTATQRRLEHDNVWGHYQEVAKGLGLEMSLHQPEEIAVDATRIDDVRFFLNGERVTPEDTIFVTHFYILPHQTQDACGQVTLYSVLEQAGFYLPIPPRIAYIGRDKLATMVFLSGSPVAPLPTVRLGTGRSGATCHYDAALSNLAYPLIVKPAYWGMGLGVSVVQNIHDLRGVIGLAGGSDTALVVQPYFENVGECRIFVIDGKPHTILRGSKDGYCLMATKASGARHEREYLQSLPELDETVSYVADKLRLPYFTLDFIIDGDRFWLSEIEPDGAVGFSQNTEQAAIARCIVEARFRAYAREHAAWIGKAERLS